MQGKFVFMKKIFSALILCIASLSASERMYIDEKEFDHKDCDYHIHVGDNVWLKTKAVHMNTTGLFTYEKDLIKDKLKDEFQKTWKCPYCYRYWPIGQACKNPDCPSKYKFN